MTGWLQTHGFEVNRVTHGRTVIEFSGTEAQVEEALHAQIHKYVVNGEEHWANANDPQIPAALAPAVAGVWTLHNFLKKTQARISPQPVAFTPKNGSQPQVTFPNSSGSPIHALGPLDYAKIYNINPVYQSGIDGTGETIAVVGRSDLYNAGQDVSDFRNFAFSLCCGLGKHGSLRRYSTLNMRTLTMCLRISIPRSCASGTSGKRETKPPIGIAWRGEAYALRLRSCQSTHERHLIDASYEWAMRCVATS